MDQISLKEVALATRGILDEPEWEPISFQKISTDSRTIVPGDLFVPLKGENFDGHRYIAQAREKGATAYLTEQAIEGRNGARTPAVRVSSTGEAYMDLAAYYRRRFSIPCIGVTGSNGKTTTKDLLGSVLTAVGPTVFSEKSFNNFVGLPSTIFKINNETRFVVLEMGTNQKGEIAALTRVASPEVGIVTNVHDCHLEGLGDRDGVAAEKSALVAGLQGLSLAILNRDDDSFEHLEKAASGRVVTFGICHRADYTAINMEVGFEGVSFEVGGVRLRLPLLGVHNIYNALAVFACARELGVETEKIASVFEGFEGPPMRLKPIQSGSLFIINDAYNANPGSTVSAIKTFSVLPSTGRKVLVLGDMLELGEHSARLHEEVGTQLACGEFELIVTVGDQAQGFLKGARKRGVDQERTLVCASAEEAIERLPDRLITGDSLLIKGSRKMGLERLVEALMATGI